MAAKRSKAQKAEIAAFVDELFAASECATWAEFSKNAAVHWASLSDWHTAKRVPDGWNLLQLIKTAGWRPPTGSEAAGARDSGLVALEKELARIASALEQQAAALRTQSQRLGRLERHVAALGRQADQDAGS